jgi:hypothetical protein
MRRWRSRRSLMQRSIHNTMTWRLPRLAGRRNYNGIKLFSEPRPVDAKVPEGIGTVIATSFISLCWFGCYIASAMRWHKCHQ